MSAKSIYYYALIPNADPNVLDQMSNSINADTKALTAIALHDNTQATTLERLSSKGNSTIKRAVASNPSTPIDLRMSLIESLNLKQILQMLINKMVNTITPDIIRKIWYKTSSGKDDYSADAQIRLQLSIQKNIPLDILKEMAEDSYYNVRLNSIRNKEIAQLLILDPNDSVRRQAEKYLS